MASLEERKTITSERKTFGGLYEEQDRKTTGTRPSYFLRNTDGSFYCSAISKPVPMVSDRRTTMSKRTSMYWDVNAKDAWKDAYVYFLLHWDHDFKYLVLFIFWYSVFFLFGAIAIFITYYYWINVLTYDSTAVLPAANSTNAITVLMIGDSLVRRPSLYFNLQGLLYDHLKPINATFVNAGKDSDTISKIAARLVPALELYNPQAVILYWDSDISDVNEGELTPPEVEVLHANYRSNLTWVINTSLHYPTVEFMTVGGPELIGEGDMCLPLKMQDKTAMLNEYRTMNRNITAMMNVSYMDIRQEFLDNLPFYWPLAFFWLTVDGEHPNYRGAHIIAKTFADQLRPWINSRTSSSAVSPSSSAVVQSEEVPILSKRKQWLWTPPDMPLQAIPKHYEKQDYDANTQDTVSRSVYLRNRLMRRETVH